MLPLYLFLILVICWIFSLYITRIVFIKLKNFNDNNFDDSTVFVEHSTQITRNISFIAFLFLIIHFFNINIISWVIFIYYTIIGVVQLILLCVSLFNEIPYNKKIVAVNEVGADNYDQSQINMLNKLKISYKVMCWTCVSNSLDELANIIMIIASYNLIR